MVKASQWSSADPQVHVVLGVLYNASRNYDSAVLEFRTALESRPDDYTLWNKVCPSLGGGLCASVFVVIAS